MKRNLTAILTGLLALGHPFVAQAYDDKSHIDISAKAIVRSNLDAALKDRLNLLYGASERVSDRYSERAIYDWITWGVVREDDNPRPVNHFHNPLRAWTRAGLTYPLGTFNSSILWAQTPELQPPAARFTWKDARNHFFGALAAPTQADRHELLARTFRTLGQVMHLLQDAASPLHSRNDQHLWVYEGIEGHVESMTLTERLSLMANPIRPDPELLARRPETPGIIPFAHLLDLTDSDQTAATPSAGIDQGLAEYANANFLSDDTIFQGFSFPRPQSLLPDERLEPSPEPASGALRIYYEKAGEGEAVTQFVAAGVFTESLAALGLEDKGWVIDTRVLDNYASFLLPRAAGYSAELIDYFLRGRVEIAAPDRYVYALAPYQDGNRGAFTKMRFKVRNATPNENTRGPGRIVAVVQYRRPVGGADLIENPSAEITRDQLYAVSAEQQVSLTQSFTEITFDFRNSPLPTNSADLFLTVVYRGALGWEDDAVLFGGKDILEPDPFDQVNVTDYDCTRGNLFQVSLLPPYNPPDTRRDPYLEGRQVLFGPWTERGIFLKTYSRSLPPQTPSETNYDFSVPQRSFAQMSRVMLIQDQSTYEYAILARELQESSTGGGYANTIYRAVNNAVVNRVYLDAGGQLRRTVTQAISYRGMRLLHGFFRLSSTTMTLPACFNQTYTRPPNLTRIEGTLPPE